MTWWKFCLAAILALSTVRADTPPTTLSVDLAHPGINVSPSLYGVFFEEINRSGDGGICGEMIDNRSFEDGDKLVGWTVEKGDGVEATTAIDTTQPLNEKNPKSLRIELTRPGEGGIGIVNNGLQGLAVKKGANYIATLYARCDDTFKGPLTASIVTSNGQKRVSGAVDGVSRDWKRFEIPLSVEETDTHANFILQDNSPGVVWLDMVSLFPAEGWKGRPFGLRADLVQMIDDIKPGFVRFPGGCWVEGETPDHSYRWKETIGDVAQRRSNYNLWKYVSTNGLGFHEYLQLCEDIGAEPLFVVNCGMSHREQHMTDRGEPVPMDNVAQWVQDALDAIEYCNGSTDTQYGALRAKAGHPAPFGLKYMEIGNENGGAAYNARYAQFYDAIKKKYPDMHLIADLWRGLPRSRPTEIIDEHYYNSAAFFLANADRYDKYDRNGPKVYVGEYAVTQGCGQGNLRAAIGEAAFMTGLERNSDVVVMASYAPLFARVGYKTWNPDAINFDQSRCYGTPSYWVQQMFSRNRAQTILPTDVKTTVEQVTPHGAIGLGTWNTQAEFKEIKVEKDGKTIYSSDFSHGMDGWKAANGDWSVKDGALRQDAQKENCVITVGDPGWSDYTLSLKARKLDGREGFLVLFNVAGDKNYTWWNIGGWGNTRHGFEVIDGGATSQIGRDYNGKIDTDRWYDIKIELAGNQIIAYLDGQEIRRTTYAPPRPIYAVAGRAGDDTVLKVVNATTKTQAVTINLNGAASIDPKATEIVLAGKPDDENSLDQPANVIPKTTELTNAAASFSHEFLANSVTILRLKAK